MYYWETISKQTGEVKQYDVAYPSVIEAAAGAKAFYEDKHGVFAINVYEESSADRAPGAVPVYSEEIFKLYGRCCLCGSSDYRLVSNTEKTLQVSVCDDCIVNLVDREFRKRR